MYAKGHCIKANNYDKLNNILNIVVNKLPEKREMKDVNSLYNLLCNLNFFRQRKDIDPCEVSNYLRYKCYEPGEYVF